MEGKDNSRTFIIESNFEFEFWIDITTATKIASIYEYYINNNLNFSIYLSRQELHASFFTYWGLILSPWLEG
jgi:hypothetical protein